MGAYRDNLKKKKAEQATDQKYFDAEEVAAAIVDALKPNGEIKKAIDNAITAALGAEGAITTWADGRYEAKQV